MINLTKVDGCYTKELKKHLKEIKALEKNSNVSVYEMRDRVIKIIEPAAFNKVAKPRFIKNLRCMRRKWQIREYVEHSIIAATYYRPEYRNYRR